MSYFKTKQTLINELLTVIDAMDLAFENKAFNPENKSFYVACYFLPASSESMGKTLASSDQDRGIFQVSVFVPNNSDNFDNVQLEKIDLIAAVFRNTKQITYNGKTVEILDSSLNEGRNDESWFRRDLSINYLTYSTR